jgi:hypothetical protein
MAQEKEGNDLLHSEYVSFLCEVASLYKRNFSNIFWSTISSNKGSSYKRSDERIASLLQKVKVSTKTSTLKSTIVPSQVKGVEKTIGKKKESGTNV